jgi:hypothetical protein
MSLGLEVEYTTDALTNKVIRQNSIEQTSKRKKEWRLEVL